MPKRPKKPCTHPGCPELVRAGQGSKCEKHKKEYTRAKDQDHDRRRGTAHERGYTARWQRYRVMYLRANPLCRECHGKGRITPATVVDHITPHKGYHDLFWNPDNHQPLCKPCHDRKTARERKDGRVGDEDN